MMYKYSESLYTNFTRDNKTGEIIDEMSLEEGDSVKKITKKQNVWAEKQKRYIQNFNYTRGFIKLYPKVIPHVLECLNNTQFGFLCQLSQFLCYDDCSLRPNGDIRKRPFESMKALAKATGVNERTCRRYCDKLYEEQLLIISEERTNGIYNKCYKINPYVVFRGTKIDKRTYNKFSETKWAKF